MADIAVTADAVKKFLDGIEADIVQFLPPGFTAARVRSFMQDAALCILQSDDLKKILATDAGKLSMTQALRTGAKSGLSLNPQEGKAALVGFGSKVTFMPMKNGYVEKLLETGSVDQVIVETVRSNDVFELEKTAKGDNYRFVPARKDRGEVDGYFACILSKKGVATVKWMTVAEVILWRDTYVPKATLYYSYDDRDGKFRKGDEKESSFWFKSPDQAGQKTVLKAAINTLKLPALDSLAALDEETWTPEETPHGTGAADLLDELKKKGFQELDPETGKPVAEPGAEPEPEPGEGEATTGEPAAEPTPAAPVKPAGEKPQGGDLF